MLQAEALPDKPAVAPSANLSQFGVDSVERRRRRAPIGEL